MTVFPSYQSNDEFFMLEAIKLARQAFAADEVPVGAVITHRNKIIAKAYNQVELLGDPTAHAEMLAITQAVSALKSKWLLDCTLYVSLEPCSMCAGALVLARIERLCFGAKDPKTGACGSVLNIVQNSTLNHRVVVEEGMQAEICGRLLSDFFQKKRRAGRENNS